MRAFLASLKLQRQQRLSYCRVMAAANVSGGRKQNTFLVRSPSISAGINGQLTFVSIFNGFPSITTFLGNALILVAPLHKESSLYPPSKLLLCSFAITDVCVGLIVEPLYVTLLATVAN